MKLTTVLLSIVVLVSLFENLNAAINCHKCDAAECGEKLTDAQKTAAPCTTKENEQCTVTKDQKRGCGVCDFKNADLRCCNVEKCNEKAFADLPATTLKCHNCADKCSETLSEADKKVAPCVATESQECKITSTNARTCGTCGNDKTKEFCCKTADLCNERSFKELTTTNALKCIECIDTNCKEALSDAQKEKTCIVKDNQQCTVDKDQKRGCGTCDVKNTDIKCCTTDNCNSAAFTALPATNAVKCIECKDSTCKEVLTDAQKGKNCFTKDNEQCTVDKDQKRGCGTCDVKNTDLRCCATETCNSVAFAGLPATNAVKCIECKDSTCKETLTDAQKGKTCFTKDNEQCTVDKDQKRGCGTCDVKNTDIKCCTTDNCNSAAFAGLPAANAVKCIECKDSTCKEVLTDAQKGKNCFTKDNEQCTVDKDQKRGCGICDVKNTDLRCCATETCNSVAFNALSPTTSKNANFITYTSGIAMALIGLIMNLISIHL